MTTELGQIARVEALESRAYLAAGGAGDLDPSFGTRGTGTVAQGLLGHTRDFAGAVAVQADGKIVVAGAADGLALARYGRDGSPDTTFGPDHDGRALLPVESGGDEPSALRVMADGRIVMAQTYGRLVYVARFKADGAIDPTFGGGSGFIRETMGGGPTGLSVGDLVVRPDGRVVIGGVVYDDDGADLLFVQYRADGTRDPSFGQAGDGTFRFRRPDSGGAVDALNLRPNGDILAAGQAGGDFAVARVTAGGRADAGFGAGGLAVTDAGAEDDAARGIVVQAGGRIVVAGVSGGDVALAGYLPDGRPDATFGVGGVVVRDLGTDGDAANDLVVQPGGELIAVGDTRQGNALGVAAARFTVDGAADTSYGTGGVAVVNFQATDTGVAAAMQADGKLLVVGARPDQGPPRTLDPDFGLARLDANGRLDATFGPAHDGKVRTGFFGRNVFAVADAIRLSDGKILTTGRYFDLERRVLQLSRFNADGTIDRTFGLRGTLLVEFAGRNEGSEGPQDAALFALRRGRFVVVATHKPGGGKDEHFTQLVAMRFDADGSRDRTFGRRGVSTTDLGVVPRSFTNGGSRLPVVRDAAGRFVAAVRTAAAPAEFRLVRLTADGAVDRSYGRDGFSAAIPGGGGGALFGLTSIGLDPAGRVVVAGGGRHLTDPAFVSRALVARFTAGGRLDRTFSPGGPEGSGLARLSFGGGGPYEDARTMVVQRDGRIVLGGVRPRRADNLTPYDLVLMRLTPDGAPDPSFGVGGITIVAEGGNGFTALAQDAGGKILAVGASSRLTIARFDTDGSPDTTFGARGATATDFYDPTSDTNGGVTRVIVQPDGRIVGVGSGRTRVVLARYLGGPARPADVTAAVRGGVLRVTGTPADDVVRLVRGDGLFGLAGGLERFPADAFSRVEIAGLDGDDVVDASTAGVPVSIDGGGGDDVLLGGAGDDSLVGGAGDDTLFGGRGRDTVRGGGGADYLNGGPGADAVFGDGGDDQVFALDGVVDVVSGGGGSDRVKGDAEDVVGEAEGALG